MTLLTHIHTFNFETQLHLHLSIINKWPLFSQATLDKKVLWNICHLSWKRAWFKPCRFYSTTKRFGCIAQHFCAIRDTVSPSPANDLWRSMRHPPCVVHVNAWDTGTSQWCRDYNLASIHHMLGLLWCELKRIHLFMQDLAQRVKSRHLAVADSTLSKMTCPSWGLPSAHPYHEPFISPSSCPQQLIIDHWIISFLFSIPPMAYNILPLKPLSTLLQSSVVSAISYPNSWSSSN